MRTLGLAILSLSQLPITAIAAYSIGSMPIKISPTQWVTEQRIKLSKKEALDIKNRLALVQQRRKASAYYSHRRDLQSLPFKQLGMAGVPVLNQGTQGTCTTFATTALLDAVFFKRQGSAQNGDVISQQCFLSLIKDSWEGASFPHILNGLKAVGVVSKAQCPYHYANTSATLTASAYASLSQQTTGGHSVVNAYQIDNLRFGNGLSNRVVNALNNNHRVLISFFLSSDHPTGSPINGYPSGLYDIKPGQTLNDICPNNTCPSHAVIVTGYDAIHHLFLIRNSWGESIGVRGDSYMSYDYMNVLANDAYTIKRV